MVAWTAVQGADSEHQSYPPYVNISTLGERVIIHVRGDPKLGRLGVECGESAVIDMPIGEFRLMAAEIMAYISREVLDDFFVQRAERS